MPAAERAGEPDATRAREVVVLAQDLIWATRLTSLVNAAGGHARQARTLGELERAARSVHGAIVDLTASSYDPIAAVESATSAELDVICVGQHEEVALRRRALAAGASRVLTYNQLHRRGSDLVAAWLARSDGASADGKGRS